MLATVVALIDKAGLTSPAPLRKVLRMYEKLGNS
jgi:hypothetical protein